MSVEPDAASGPSSRRRSGLRPRSFPDPLYGEVRLSGWISPVLDTPPFRRLSGVSLSDVPGEMLFQHAFPSRLDHSRGVYALARAARPRDRALHVAALAHDLGHGPLSHLTEPLMIEQLGVDHEHRSVQLLEQVRASLAPAAVRQMAWLDWDEVAALMLGKTADGRGALLNGRMDYDNLDHVARFLLAGELAQPSYDPRQAARSLRPCAPSGPTDTPGVVLLPEGLECARAWLADRVTVYNWLHEGHRNLASHAMLRKAVDLAAQAAALPRRFFDMTDGAVLAFLGRQRNNGQAALVGHVMRDSLYTCVWEAEIPQEHSALPDLFGRWHGRLELEATLAAESGLAPHEVVADVLVSSAYRELPPLLSGGGIASAHEPPPDAPPCIFHLFVAPSAGRDYQRRLRMAAERYLCAMGAVPRDLSAND
ncbi:MAG: HD domain-containing protein [Nitrososphaerota archaeon]